MKIAVYHNLETGGALFQVTKICESLIKMGNSVDLYSLNNNAKIHGLNYKRVIKPTTPNNNIFNHLKLALHEIPQINKKIAHIISKSDYKLILIFPCLISQTPSIVRQLSKNNRTIYFFLESKREFYENTTFDHDSLRRTLARVIRLPIKFFDKLNCRSANLIVSNSCYIAWVLKNKYQKKSTVIYPGLIKKPSRKVSISNNRKALTIGLISKIKGYEFSLKQVKGIGIKYTAIGKKSYEQPIIEKEAKDHFPNFSIINSADNHVKINYLYNSTLFLVNQQNEPFGIATLESSVSNNFILGLNSGGTPEIVETGLNGILYKKDIPLARKVLININKKDKINTYAITSIDWEETTKRITRII